MQLHALSQSGFDPLSRTCRFMLTEEAHHMFVGQSGVGRIIERTCAAMREAGLDDPTDVTRVRSLGVIDLPTIQKRINLHFSLTLDLFGNDVSTNAANAYNAGLKGRYLEDQIDDDHRLIGATYPVPRLKCGRIVVENMPAITSLNVRLRDDYVKDAASGAERWWNRIIARAGYDFRLRLPHVAFHRHIGEFAGIHADPEGNLLSEAEWEGRRGEFLPSRDDDAYVASLMRPVTEPGAFATWIAPPRAGIDGKPGNFEYVKLQG
jgi:benzoyl-CoA 2,3-dioxygenase component B